MLAWALATAPLSGPCRSDPRPRRAKRRSRWRGGRQMCRFREVLANCGPLPGGGAREGSRPCAAHMLHSGAEIDVKLAHLSLLSSSARDELTRWFMRFISRRMAAMSIVLALPFRHMQPVTNSSAETVPFPSRSSSLNRRFAPDASSSKFSKKACTRWSFMCVSNSCSVRSPDPSVSASSKTRRASSLYFARRSRASWMMISRSRRAILVAFSTKIPVMTFKTANTMRAMKVMYIRITCSIPVTSCKALTADSQLMPPVIER
mmetsp:Transcript_24581/g.71111  ORF Transcript_24581/g.71111 Transcript_24581/m.71111 type:complete len:262 (+) Transcript_24581:57-842(+)